MRTFLSLAASGAAVAAVATLALGAPANASVVPLKAHTTLSIVAARNVIKAGQKDAIGGTLRSDRTRLGRRAVVLDRVNGRPLVPVGPSSAAGWSRSAGTGPST
jgi:membrane protein implicated in regulation of membrane protease activity